MRCRLASALLLGGVACASEGQPQATADAVDTELTGCYDVTVGEWVVESRPLFSLRRVPVPSERGDSTDYEIPPRIEFAGPRDPPSSGTTIVVPEGALPSVHAYMGGELAGDSLDLWFSTGYAGVTATLVRSGDDWVGTARTFIDVSRYPVHGRPITLTPAACDTPPPVPIDEMRPALARSVELEDGSVITLGEALPEPLETESESAPPAGNDSRAASPWDWQLVTGRTRGLFGATDSVAVTLSESREVTQVRLRYLGAEAFAVLDERLRGEYGAPLWSDSGSIRFGNRIMGLSLHRRASGGAEILLY